MQQPHRLATIGQFHRLKGLAPPEHPLLSVIDVSAAPQPSEEGPSRLVFDFFAIALMSIVNGRVKYRQQLFDFDSGMLGFSGPGQVIGMEVEPGKRLEQSGWLLLIHPDFLWNTPLAKKIKQYDFFDYAVNEALFLSEKENVVITALIDTIRQESARAIDHFT